MEKYIKIRTPDGKYIYGTFNVKGKREDSLVIFVHGLICDQNDHLYLNGSRFLNNRGFATFRFNLYGHQKNARKLQQCTVSLHGKDVTRVVDYFKREGFKKIFLTGHSLGCPSILLSDTSKAEGIVFWDPSIDLHKKDDEKIIYRYNKKLDSYIIHWDTDTIFGKNMINEWKKFPDCRDLVKKTHVPIKIICAGKGILVKGGKDYYGYANPPKDFVVIPKAGHCFDEEGTEELLFTETLSWLKTFR